ncbi:hypothetical protein PVAND_009518 [Polypedilum vanderplanki]|uniref:Uncharacterized protein n=1 Tax=Polypedilum vanderplanki TaxID=319348 RepID=A0A9J6CDF3_POLVA|nr:hypothetical protein PVAND_009518 [Polypedilum vanderplanki]
MLVFVASIHCSAIKSEQSHHEHAAKGKDHHMGFFGSRGKRSINSDENVLHERDIKDWPMLRESLYNFDRNIRAPKGFYGLRGKKDFLSEEKRALLGIQQNLNGLRDRTRFIEGTPSLDEAFQPFNPKRAPTQGFFGVRGKKFSDYNALDGGLSEKRAPKGFLGMRGKKSGENVDDEIEDPQIFDYNLYEKRVPSGFMGVRGKKNSQDDSSTMQ